MLRVELDDSKGEGDVPLQQQTPMTQNFSTGKRAMIFGRRRILIPETVVRNKLQVCNICFHLIISILSQSRFWRTKKKRNNHVTL
jgi:hypothetical protein